MSANVQYIFTGFQDRNAIRQFAFDRIAEDRTRTQVKVEADMALAREYKILLQDLPLLCVRLLASIDDEAIRVPVVFSEERMMDVQNAARVAAERKPPKRPRPSPAVGQAWRTTGREGVPAFTPSSPVVK